MTSDQAKTYALREQRRPLNVTCGKSRQSNEIISFLLNSQDDHSMLEAIKRVESLSLSRNRLCIVSIFGKEPINSNTRDELLQSMTTNSHRAQKPENNSASSSDYVPPKATQHYSRDGKDATSSSSQYETQILGQVDFNSNIVFLNIKSFLSNDETIALNNSIERSQKGIEISDNCTLADNWPGLCHNIIKTLLIVFIVSHVIVCHSPEPQIDYNLLRLLKNLNTLRLKASPRISDLLSSIATSRGFPVQWIKQARVCRPRLLLLHDISRVSTGIEYQNLKALRKQLEDQAYGLLRGTNLVSRSVKDGLFEVPDQGDFLFLLTKEGSDSDKIKHTSTPVTDLDIVCEDVLRLLSRNGNHTPVASTQSRSSTTHEEFVSRITDNEKIQFKKFLQQHISVIQTNSQANRFHGSTNSPNLLLPRCDDFLLALAKLRTLLFPIAIADGKYEGEQKLVRWHTPDLRQFVDIYDLNNIDEIFSKHYCHKANLAALDTFRKVIALENQNFDEALQVARDSYLKYARGSERDSGLNKLIYLCNKNWSILQNSAESKPIRQSYKIQESTQQIETIESPRVTKSCVISDTSASTSRGSSSRKSKDIVITRHLDGVKLTTSCDCGRKTNLFVAPLSRSKRLERISVRYAETD